MKAQITKLKGGELPDGFWVKGHGGTPKMSFGYYLNPVTDMSKKTAFDGSDTEASLMTNWFVTNKIERVWQNLFGDTMFIAGGSLWMWKEAK